MVFRFNNEEKTQTKNKYPTNTRRKRASIFNIIFFLFYELKIMPKHLNHTVKIVVDEFLVAY